jgi:hypothetical protein
MDTKFDFGDSQMAQTVYVRKVATSTLPKDVQEQLDGVTNMYAVHDIEGERLALVRDRNLAFTIARQNEMQPVSVH